VVDRTLRHARAASGIALLVFGGQLLAPSLVRAQKIGAQAPPATTPAPPRATPAPARDTSVHLVVTLDHPDWRYHVGDSARFHLSLDRGGRAIPGAKVRIEIGKDRMKPSLRDTLALTPSGMTLPMTLDEPGFVRAIATVVIGGVTYSERATAAFDPERIVATTPMPEDFMEFWGSAIASARKVPLDVRMVRLPGRSTAEVNVYHISFQNDRVGSRIYGMLSVPAKPGKYPAILTVPGAGVRPYFPRVDLAKKGVIHLAIGIHGIPVDRDSLLYSELRATALKDYWAYRLEDRDNYYYKRVYVGVVRAGDFIATLPQFDGRNYAVEGGSQGGALTFVAGALDPRVTAVAASHPALGDQFAFLHGRTSGWPFMLSDTAHLAAKAEKMATIPYYDTINFARLLKVPGIYTWGFNDTTVPPTASYAIYNVITAPKELDIAKEAGHARTAEQAAHVERWLFEALECCVARGH
jgi:cephalosporin-C deacetylase-like acetyl esterase